MRRDRRSPPLVGSHQCSERAGPGGGGHSFTRLVGLLIVLLLGCLTRGVHSAVPTVSVSSLVLQDQDLDASQLGGSVTWTAPGSVAQVTHYDVYLATDSSGTGRSQVGLSVAVGTNEAALSTNTPLMSYTHVLVYTANADGQQAVPSAYSIEDASASVSGLTFDDRDLDNYELGGNITWSPPADTTHVNQYVAFLATDPTGSTRSQVSAVSLGTNQAILPKDTYRPPWRYVLVYTQSSLAEQTTAASALVGDFIALVISVGFLDEDLDAFELGGYITWQTAGMVSALSHHSVYLALNSFGMGRTLLGEVPVGTNVLLMDENFVQGGLINILVYTASTFAESTNAAAVGIFDSDISISSIAFTDQDLDPEEIGGTVTWQVFGFPPLSHFVVYLAIHDDGRNRTITAPPVAFGSNHLDLPADIQLDDYQYIVVYTKSSLFEQTTPLGFPISDEERSVSGISFQDLDLDDAELGGYVTWVPPADPTLVVGYHVYLAEDMAGGGRQEVGAGVLAPTTVILMTADHAEAAFQHILVYTRSILAEQTTPVAFNFSDLATIVPAVNLTDLDLDAGNFGGDAYWDPPADVSQVTHYVVYVAADAAGTGRVAMSGNLSLGTHTTPVPPDQVNPWLLVYVSSSLAEQTTPAALRMSDTIAGATVTSFIDRDLDAEDLGGTILFARQGDLHLITVFRVYLAAGADGALKSQVGADLSVGTNFVEVPVESPKGNFSHVVVYAKSVLTEQTTPAFLLIHDTDSPVLNLALPDKDLDATELAGVVTWDPPTDIAQVLYYVVFLSTSAAGAGRSMIGQSLPVGNHTADLAEDTVLAPFTHVIVYTQSDLAEQTTPVAVALSDAASSVVNMNFVDEDMDELELGGMVRWSPPPDYSQVTHYYVYLSLTDSGGGRSLVGQAVPFGTNQVFLIDNTLQASFVFVVVYSSSSLFEQTTPIAGRINDTSISVAYVDFVDKDLDLLELGGTVSWGVPTGASGVAFYTVYLATDATGAGRLKIGADVPVNNLTTLLPPDQALGSFTHIVVYTKSPLGLEQSVPRAVRVNDTSATASNATLTDVDLDAEELGGIVNWTNPPEVTHVTGYNLYLAFDAAGTGRSQFGPDLPFNTPLGNFTHVLVYTFSSLVEQTTPVAGVISDAASLVRSIALDDKDLDEGELAGVVTWLPPLETTHVASYAMFLATNALGQQLSSLLAQVPFGTGKANISEDEPIATFTHVVIFTESAADRQTTPSALAISDAASSVTSIFLADKDLDLLELGGVVTWTPPPERSQVVEYFVYLQAGTDNANRSQLEVSVPLGVNKLVIPPETPRESIQTHITVYARSSLYEQTTPFSVPINDSDSKVRDITFVDKDLDEHELGGIVTWSEPYDSLQVVEYLVYLASGLGAGANRSQLGLTVPLGTNQLGLVMGVALGNFTHVSIYTASSLVEQTTPASASLSDTIARVSDVAFADLDLDLGQLGGTVTWNEPAEVTHVTSYSTYLAHSAYGVGRLQVGPSVNVGTNTSDVPADTSKSTFTHFVIYAASVFAEQTTPANVSIVDTSSSVTGIEFKDLDLDRLELGGEIRWQAPSDAVYVTNYVVSVARSAVGSGRFQVGITNAGVFNFSLLPNFPKGSYSHILVHTMSVLAEQTTPVALLIDDTDSTVDDVLFLDQDLDGGELGGYVTWSEPTSRLYVTHYLVYFASGPAGEDRSLLGDPLPAGTVEALLPGDFLQGIYDHALVYTRSNLTEQTTPAFANVSDAAPLIRSVFFEDKDLDVGELGGPVTWLEPEDLAQVYYYAVYLAKDSNGTNRSLIGDPVAVGTNLHVLPADTVLANRTHMLVYARSLLFEQRVPASSPFQDSKAVVFNISFVDKDLDISELGGTVTWNPPPVLVHVAHYAVYLAADSDGENKTKVIGDTAVGTNVALLPANTSKALLTHIVVYVSSSFVEQTTPDSFIVADTDATVASLTFFDQDLDPFSVAGLLSWTPAADLTQVTEYVVYVSTSSDGLQRTPPLVSLLIGTNVFDIPIASGMAAASHILVYTKSSLAEQTTPAALRFNDTASTVENLAFIDKDPDADELGGMITWQEPEEAGQVIAYVVYLAASSTGQSRSQIGGDVVIGTNYMFLSLDTQQGPYTHVIVYSKSPFHEQTTPAALTVTDTNLNVTELEFLDKDLDDLEIGGYITWLPPFDPEGQLVDHAVFLCNNSAGEGRLLIENVTAGTNIVYVPVDTPRPALTHLAVYSSTSLAEQTTPEAIAISDASSSASSLSFFDRDLDETELGGRATWSPPVDVSQVAQYVLYLAYGANASDDREQVGSTAPVGTNFILIPPDTNRSNYSHLAVYSMSSLAEQTTPNIFMISDTASTVASVSFPDEDLDAGELGGTVSWLPPSDVSMVTHYVLYLSVGLLGYRVQAAVGLAVGANSQVMPPESPLGAFTHVLVFTNSSLVEQTTPASLEISDTSATVSSVSFEDYDLDVDEFGGDLNFTVPDDTSRVVAYNAYFGADITGLQRSQIGGDLFGPPKQFPPDFQRGTLTYVLVYTKSSLVEQTTPAGALLSDTVAGAIDVAFTDLDLDATDLGGTVTWNVTGDLDYVEDIAIYLGNSYNRSLLGIVSLGTYELTVNPDHPKSAWTKVNVHTRSSLAERSVPFSLNISDTASTVQGLSFEDQDLDGGELTGTITWSEPSERSQVQDYLVYFAQSQAGLAKSQLGADLGLGTTVLVVPSDFVKGSSTHIVVFSRSSLAEQTTPAALLIVDAVTEVDTISFPDEDFDGLELGGYIMWNPPNVSSIADYRVYFATSSSGQNRSQIGTPLVYGTNAALVPVNTPIEDFTHVVVYIRSALVEQTTPAFHLISDSAFLVSGISFPDLDLDAAELGGNITWALLPDEALVAGYEVYIAQNSSGLGRSLVGSVVAGKYVASLAPDTAVSAFTHVLIYARSSLAEQTTPSAQVINDTIANVSQVTFPDQDLDETELGGPVTWTPPGDDVHVSHYVLYLSQTVAGGGRSQVGEPVPVGSNVALVPADTLQAGFVHAIVYTRSVLTEQTTPVGTALSDTIASISNLAFVDDDLDGDELGGLVLWSPPLDTAQVLHYLAYLAFDGAGANRSQIGVAVALGTNSILLPADQPLGEFTHVVLYTRSATAEQSTPIAVLANDTNASVSAVFFDDLDLDAKEVAGNVTWNAPEDVSRVVQYHIYLAASESGAGRSQIGLPVTVGTNVFAAPGDVNSSAFGHVVVYAASGLFEQTTPTPFLFSDTFASVSGISFTDQDLDFGELGGEATWSQPSDMSRVAAYVVYLAATASGSGRSQVDVEVPPGTNVFVFPLNVIRESRTHLVVYTRSILVEQTTPTPFLFSDTVSSVTSLFFTDKDLDAGELGGTITWVAPAEASLVTNYLAYLSNSSDGENRSQIGAAISYNDSSTEVPVDTALKSYTQIALFTQSLLFEQSTPATFDISDANSVAQSVVFPDEDLDATQLGGYATWQPPDDVSQVTHYLVYLATTPAGDNRFQIGTQLQLGTNSILIPENTVAKGQLTVYTRSSLVEQTTPAALSVHDSESSVLNATFIDKDLDAGEIGGEVVWEEPPDAALLTHYEVYRSITTHGFGRSSLYNSPSIGTNSIPVAADLALGIYPYILVYAKSSLFEQTTPQIIEINDTVSVPAIIVVSDRDLDEKEIGGRIAWTPPRDIAQVTMYILYMALDTTGTGRRNLYHDALVGTNEVILTPNTSLPNFTFLLVYARSSLAEQTTPDAFPLSDAVATVASVAFTDEDLDVSELGGMVTWLPPIDQSRVVHYVVYLATSSQGSGRSQIETSVVNGTYNRSLPSDTPLASYTYVVVYTESSLCEQTTPNYVRISDTSSDVRGILFTDLDLDDMQIGGNITWDTPLDFALVEHYVVYVASGIGGENRTQVGPNVPNGTNVFQLAPDFDLGPYTHILLYTRSSLVEQSAPVALTIVDEVRAVSTISFADRDADDDELGGFVYWVPPADLALVTHYNVYLADTEAGLGRSQIGPTLLAGTNVVHFPANTAQGTFVYVVVYVASVLTEQTTPTALEIVDSASSVLEVNFTDKDLGAGELGGFVSWTPTPFVLEVVGYVVYLAAGLAGEQRSQLANVTAQITEVIVPAHQPLGNFTHVLVYARSPLAEQTTPVGMEISDTIASVSAVNFVDRDLDLEELGGVVTWEAAAPDIYHVTHYMVYLASTAGGQNRSQIGLAVPVGVNFVDLPPHEPLSTHEYAVVYTMSSFTEQSTPVSFLFNDTFSTVTDVELIDRDLDPTELGGTVTWTPPEERSLVRYYVVYFAEDEHGAARFQHREPVPEGTNILVVPVDFQLLDFTHIVVYTNSTLVEQTTPGVFLINDTNSSVSEIEFPEKDLDFDDLGGRITWRAPEDTLQVTYYVVYLAADTSGGNRSQIGVWVPVGTEFIDLPFDQTKAYFDFVLVYTRSSLIEQTTPVTFFISDTSSSITNLVFIDRDLDYEDLGGAVTWETPQDISQTIHYVAYLATDYSGSNRSQIAPIEPVGINVMHLVPNTTTSPFTHVLVYTASTLVEQTTPVALLIVDSVASVSFVSLLDGDLDEEELGGTISWTAPTDTLLVTFYNVYLSVGAAGFGRSQVGARVGVGMERIDLPVDRPLAAYEHVVVFTRSTLVEQTTPVGSMINDTVSRVVNVSFTDRDLDGLELGGNVTWLPAGDSQEVTHYLVYLARNSTGMGRSQIASAAPSGTNVVHLDSEQPLEDFAYIAVFARSSLTEQTTPATTEVSDSAFSIVNLTFTDRDLDIEELGGSITWAPPSDITLVTYYFAYLAESEAGDNRSTVSSEVAEGTNVVFMLPNRGLEAFSHIVVFTKSLLVEQTTPIAMNTSDTIASISSLYFLDNDLDEEDLGGTITWSPPGDTEQVTFYMVYFANSTTGFGRTQIGLDVKEGITVIDVPVDYDRGNLSHVLTYTRSSLCEQTTPIAYAISDAVAVVANVSFLDLDLDPLQLGGTVTWEAPEDTLQVTHYDVYLAVEANGNNRSLMAHLFVNLTEQAFLLPDEKTQSFEYIVVYTRSSLTEQTTPTALQFIDRNSSAADAAFVDLDLDGTEIGGTVTWRSSGDWHLVVRYIVFLSVNASGDGRSQLGSAWLAPTTHHIDMPPDHANGDRTYVTIYTRSSLTEQTTPVFVFISDSAWSVSDVSFLDLDLDEGQLGGNVTWRPPQDETLVTHYAVYLAGNESGFGGGANRSQLGPHVPVGTNYNILPMHHEQELHTHFVVFTKSALVEQTTPVALELNDTVSIITGIVFVDKDLDEEELGGEITWIPPTDISQVTYYSIYLAFDGAGFNRSQIGEDVPLGNNHIHLPPDQPLDLFTHIVVYSKSDFTQQTTPTAFSISDTIANVEAITFLDRDLDAEEVGGDVSWNATGDLFLVTHFAVYFAEHDAAFAARTRTGHDVPAAQVGDLFIPPDLSPPLNPYAFLAVHTSSSLHERTTPVAIRVSDTISSVSGIVFVDLDLDETDLGGNITWEEPVEAAEVTYYTIHLAIESSGYGRSQIGEDVEKGTNLMFLPAETTTTAANGTLEYVVVYTRSSLLEQTTPVFLFINDTLGMSEISFDDKDLDATQMGGTITWKSPESVDLTTHYIVFFALEANGTGRSQFGEELPVGTNTAVLAPEHYYDPYTYILVYTRSVLVEQTTPGFLLFVDVDASVTGLAFNDTDLDELELGGTIVWEPPSDISQVTHYLVYLASNEHGLGRSLVANGVVPLGTDERSFAPELPLAAFATVLVYTRSTLVEQTTPVAFTIHDTQARVGNLTFTDSDLDLDMLGGFVTWSLPPDISQVTTYVGYLALAPVAGYGGSRRQEFETPYDDELYDLPLQTPQSGYDYFLVYTRSALVEQTTPAGVEIVDSCENIPALGNSTMYVEQGIHAIDYFEVVVSRLMAFAEVTMDGLHLKIVTLRKGRLYVAVTTLDDALVLNKNHVVQLAQGSMINAVGGPDCRQDKHVLSCTVVDINLTSCAMQVGAVYPYRLHVLLDPEFEPLPDYAYVDFMVASSYFKYGPRPIERSTTRMRVRFTPSHSGFLWMYIVPREGGAADYLDTIQKVKRGPHVPVPPGCVKLRMPILGLTAYSTLLEQCDFKLGGQYRLFVYIEDPYNRHDGTLRTIDFTYLGELTLDQAIPFSMPVPTSYLWRVLPLANVSREWRVRRLRLFEDVKCTRLVAIFPAPYRDPYETSLQEDAPVPNGAAFSLPGPLPASRAAVSPGVSEREVGWTSGHPCTVRGCHLGFSFGDLNRGVVFASGAPPSVSVGCAEVEQSEAEGEYATSLELQYWEEDVGGYIAYRSASGLTGGASFIPHFDATVLPY